jgi:hypothetical protein
MSRSEAAAQPTPARSDKKPRFQAKVRDVGLYLLTPVGLDCQ